jgi:4-hydroxy-3-methylbut-2-en-1-yl diphosphate synthase IspG/GcpE
MPAELQYFADCLIRGFSRLIMWRARPAGTLFNLQTTTAKIKAATSHLKGVKIAIMGCIVNGPGEMADADFGYVGGAPGRVNLYVGKTAVKFNIPEAEAVDSDSKT